MLRCAPKSMKLWPAMLLLAAAGCSHPALQGDSAHTNPHPIPFHEASPVAPTTVSDSTVQDKTGLPFQDVESLPVGTLLTVRLNNLVSAEHPGPTNTFEAVLDEPVRIDGNVVVPRGSTVSGYVESAQMSDVKKNRGYICLDLQSIALGGRALPLQTSSLFTRVTAGMTLVDGGKSSTNIMTLEKGRRLTFRLIAPVYLAAQRSTAAQ